jgi:DNA uptake protein ComE-like DNA-binding protein
MNRFIARRLLAATASLAVLAACKDGRGEGSAQGGTTSSTAGAAATAAGTSTGSQGASGASGSATASTATFLDPNVATREQLLAVPGINAATADAIVAARPYQNMTAVDRVVSGAKLTEQQRDSVYTRLWKPIDLNTASAQEIELIPGVGPRMRHEFEEYRPYRSIEKFRREIGKYVNQQEVARLERYVTIGGQRR